MMRNPEVVIVGAGLSGLACALHLHRERVAATVLEASDGVGGRVRTDSRDGFQFDRGFQVFLTAYPEAQQILDYPSLDLRSLLPGASVRYEGEFYAVSDPWRHPWRAVGGWGSRIGRFADKWRLGSFRRDLRQVPLAEIFERPETSASKMLRDAGFSESLIARFFQPFFGSVFLDAKLHASSRMFEFLYRMLLEGDVAIPARGMGAIPEQIAGRLAAGSIRLNTRVVAVGPGEVTLDSGEILQASAVVIATEGPEAARLTNAIPPPASRSATCLYFAAPEPPVEEPILVLNGNSRGGPVNHLCVLSQVAPEYAPPGQALVSVTVLGRFTSTEEEVETAVIRQLTRWFGREVKRWKRLAVYRVPHAQPDQAPPLIPVEPLPVRLACGFYICGDHRQHASIDGALASGRRAAEAVLEDLRAGA